VNNVTDFVNKTFDIKHYKLIILGKFLKNADLDKLIIEKPGNHEKKSFNYRSRKIFFYTAVTLGMLLPSCKSDELKDQINGLTQQQVLLSNEKDSLLR